MPLTPEKKARLESVQGYVMLIRKPDDPVWYGPCENSFSLSTEEWRTFFYWSSLPDSGHNPPIDGLEWLRRDLSSWKDKHPDWLFSVFDARDAKSLPVVLNWGEWLDAHEPREGTMSGVKNKYWARNVQFTVKPEVKETRVQGTFTF